MSSQMPQNDPRYVQIIKGLLPYVFTLLGFAGGYSVAQKVTQQPVLQVIIVIATSLLAYAVSFIGKVWQRWESTLIDKTAAWGPSFLKNIFGGYYRRYLHYLSHAHRIAEFTGLFQRPAYHRDIDRIFVEPDIAPVPPHLASSHLFKRIQLTGARSHTIWHYLKNKKLTSDALVLLGAAGSGKTTVLKYIAYTLSQERLYAPPWHGYRLPYSFPVLLSIREQLPIIKEKPEATLPELIQIHIKKNKRELVIPLQWIEQQLKQGNCLIMLDGLDEAPNDGERKLVIEWVRGQMRSYYNNRFMLTARPHGYIDTPIDGATVLQIQPFTLVQIKSFSEKWYLIDEHMRSGKKNDAAVRARASEGAGNLLARLYQKPSLLALAANPLLLTMTATLYSTGGTIPDNRSDLYHEIFRVLLYKRREVIGLPSKLNVPQKLEVLQPLAYHMMQQRLLEIERERIRQVITPHLARVTTEITTDEFLKDIEQNSALLLEVAGTWSFAHKTLQEYLTATHIKEKRRENTLLKHLHDDWWHETICFYCAQADATKVLETCLMEADTSVQMLDLALDCNNQKLKAEAAVTEKIDELLQAGIEDSDPKKRGIVAEALLKRRLENMVYLHNDVYTDTSLVSCAEYQLFLDAQSEQGKYYHPWHWHAATFESGQGHEPVLGVQPEDVDAFCRWLTERESGAWLYRQPFRSERSQINALLDKAKYFNRRIGFWTKEVWFHWIDGGAEPEYPDLEKLVLDQLLLDRAKALSYERVRTSDRSDLLDKALELEQHLKDKQVPDITPLLVDDIHNFEVYPYPYSLTFSLRGIFSPSQSPETQEDDGWTLPDPLHYLRQGLPSSLLYSVLEVFAQQSDKHTSPPYTKEAEHFRWLIRYLSQLEARRTFSQIEQADALQKKKQQSQQQIQETRLAREVFLFFQGIAIDFALMELRARGKLPPCEGIVLVKERRQESH